MSHDLGIMAWSFDLFCMSHDLRIIPNEVETMDWSYEIFVCHMTLEQWPGHVTLFMSHDLGTMDCQKWAKITKILPYKVKSP